MTLILQYAMDCNCGFFFQFCVYHGYLREIIWIVHLNPNVHGIIFIVETLGPETTQILGRKSPGHAGVEPWSSGWKQHPHVGIYPE